MAKAKMSKKTLRQALEIQLAQNALNEARWIGLLTPFRLLFNLFHERKLSICFLAAAAPTSALIKLLTVLAQQP